MQRDYDMWFGQDRRASACIACGQCEEKCPQSLTIFEIMKKALTSYLTEAGVISTLFLGFAVRCSISMATTRF